MAELVLSWSWLWSVLQCFLPHVCSWCRNVGFICLELVPLQKSSGPVRASLSTREMLPNHPLAECSKMKCLSTSMFGSPMLIWKVIFPFAIQSLWPRRDGQILDHKAKFTWLERALSCENCEPCCVYKRDRLGLMDFPQPRALAARI